MKYVITLLCSLCWCFMGLADEGRKPNEIFRPASKHNVQNLLDRGVAKIGELDLRKLLDQLESVEWRTFDGGFIGIPGKERTTSIYVVKDKMVVINTLAIFGLVGKPVPIFSWSLHEGLGALGHLDENYELSGAISFLASAPDDEHFKTRLEVLRENFSHIEMRGEKKWYQLFAKKGGATIVGGGGDAALCELKQQLLNRYEEMVSEEDPFDKAQEMGPGIKKIIALKIEFDLQDQNRNELKFTFNKEGLFVGSRGMTFPGELFERAYLDAILKALKGPKGDFVGE